MNLINRYVTEVGKRLPLLKGREDIEKELRSTLEDMLEDRAQKAGRPADEALEIELLKEYGAPQTVAATYNPQPYLIGPRLFPFFLMVLKIVIPIVVTVLLVLAGIRAATETPFMGADFVNIVGAGLGEAFSAAIAAFGNIALVFAILERVLPDEQIDDLKMEEDWNPASLAAEPDPDSVKRGELIAEIVFTFVGLAILNLYPNILGMGFFMEDEWIFIPMFSAAFFAFIPWINATFLAEILLDIYLLRSALWTPLTRVAKIIIEAAGIALAVIILRTPNIIGFTGKSFANSSISADAAQTLTTVFTIMFPVILIIVIIVQGIEIAKAVYRLFKAKYQTR
ncbi:MAG: hypothetical protein HZB18_17555 [Chloroflexi bacterium]|nr:hypothetical protein [Chloroflexota bacterium]